MLDDVDAIRFEQNLHAARIAFHFLCAFTQTMAFAGVASFYFAGSGYFESLLGTRMGFNLGHFHLLIECYQVSGSPLLA